MPRPLQTTAATRGATRVLRAIAFVQRVRRGNREGRYQDVARLERWSARDPQCEAPTWPCPLQTYIARAKVPQLVRAAACNRDAMLPSSNRHGERVLQWRAFDSSCVRKGDSSTYRLFADALRFVTSGECRPSGSAPRFISTFVACVPKWTTADVCIERTLGNSRRQRRHEDWSMNPACIVVDRTARVVKRAT